MPLSADRISQINTGIKRSALALAALGAVQVGLGAPDVQAQSSSKPSTDFQKNNLGQLILNSGECLQLGVNKQGGGPIEGSMTMSVHRFYTEVDNLNRPVRDITEALKTSTDTYDDLDLAGNKVDTVQGLEPTFSDWKVSVVNGNQEEIIRGRFAQNQEDTQGYWIKRGATTWDNVGESITFRSERVDGKVTVKTNCGIDAEVDGFMVKKDRLLRNGVTKAVNNAIVWIGRNCTLRDVMTQEHSVRLPNQPEQPAPVVNQQEQPEAPAQVPGRRNVSSPAQVPGK